jgi:hypothetical protein
MTRQLLAPTKDSFLHRCQPVHYHGERRLHNIAAGGIHQQALAIGGDRIDELVEPWGNAWDASLKQRLGSRRFEHRTRAYIRLHGHRHQLALRCQIEHLLAIVTPPRKLAPTDRNLPFARFWRKRADIDLLPSRLVGRVGDPMAVRRELALRFVERALEKWDWLRVASGGTRLR